MRAKCAESHESERSTGRETENEGSRALAAWGKSGQPQRTNNTVDQGLRYVPFPLIARVHVP